MNQRLNCPNCMAPLLDPVPGSVCQCQYCQTSITIPAPPPPPDRLENLYDELNAIDDRWSAMKANWMTPAGSEPTRPIMSYPWVAVPVVLVTVLFMIGCYFLAGFPFGPGFMFMAGFLLFASLHSLPRELGRFREFDEAKRAYSKRRDEAEERIQRRMEAAQNR